MSFQKAHAAFQDNNFGARAMGLGSAFVAVADDPTALFMNPAGIAQTVHPEISMMYAKPLAGLDVLDMNQGHIAAVAPTRWGSVGVGMTSFVAENLMQEYRGMVGYAFSLNGVKRTHEDSHRLVWVGGDWRPENSYHFDSGSYPDLLAGINLAYLFHSYPIGKQAPYSQDPAFSGGVSKGAVGVDAGFLLRMNQRVSVGMAGRNLNRPDVGVSGTDQVAREIQGGVRWDLRAVALSADGLLHTAYPSANTLTWHLGAEAPIYKMLTLRLGLETSSVDAGFGVRISDSFSLDYATQIAYGLIQTNFGTHQFEFSYRFGSLRKTDETSLPDQRVIYLSTIH